jgi:hypothetical protein
MSEHEYDGDLFKAIEALVAHDVFGRGAPAFDIAQKVIASGYDSLSRKERQLYDAVVVPALKSQGSGAPDDKPRSPSRAQK